MTTIMTLRRMTFRLLLPGTVAQLQLKARQAMDPTVATRGMALNGSAATHTTVLRMCRAPMLCCSSLQRLHQPETRRCGLSDMHRGRPLWGPTLAWMHSCLQPKQVIPHLFRSQAATHPARLRVKQHGTKQFHPAPLAARTQATLGKTMPEAVWTLHTLLNPLAQTRQTTVCPPASRQQLLPLPVSRQRLRRTQLPAST